MTTNVMVGGTGEVPRRDSTLLVDCYVVTVGFVVLNFLNIRSLSHGAPCRVCTKNLKLLSQRLLRSSLPPRTVSPRCVILFLKNNMASREGILFSTVRSSSPGAPRRARY